MEFQFHPASGRGRVRRLGLAAGAERLATVACALAALAAISLWVTVPSFVVRSLREERSAAAQAEFSAARSARRDVEARTLDLRGRALDAGARLSQIAFLYEVAPSRWPRSLNPETGVVGGNEPDRIVENFPRYLAGMERGLSLLSEREREDPAIATRTPSRLPLTTDLVEPSAVFGPRLSPWTGSEEFFTGLDLAAPAGSPVVAPADGTVVFAGRSEPSASSRFWRYGNFVVVSHGRAGATLLGHLARVDVRRGARVSRGARLGSVGATGWAMSPELHYEFWRWDAGRLAPTDPRFAILDRRLLTSPPSLERMAGTFAPGNLESLPGVGPGGR